MRAGSRARVEGWSVRAGALGLGLRIGVEGQGEEGAGRGRASCTWRSNVCGRLEKGAKRPTWLGLGLGLGLGLQGWR